MYMLNCYMYFFSDQNQSFESTAENYISLFYFLRIYSIQRLIKTSPKPSLIKQSSMLRYKQFLVFLFDARFDIVSIELQHNTETRKRFVSLLIFYYKMS